MESFSRDPLLGLYSEIEAYNSGFLKVSQLHSLYFEEAGNPNGKPILFLHGGPGGRIYPSNRRLFNPQAYRIILFDQRGCGKSTPKSVLEENTTWELVDDIEQLRTHLKIEKLSIYGGSWGSSLALLYTIKYPKNVIDLVLRGVFLCRRIDINWFTQDGAQFIFPDVFDEFSEYVNYGEGVNVAQAYMEQFLSQDPQVKRKAVELWNGWEGCISALQQDIGQIKNYVQNVQDDDIAMTILECHYCMNEFFLEDNFILQNIDKIKHIPCIIVQGRYDIVCPMYQAWSLHKIWPGSEIIIIPDAGHISSQPGISRAIVDATDQLSTHKE